MATRLRWVIGKNQGLPASSSLALILAGTAPIVVLLAGVALVLTFVVPLVLVVALLTPLAVFWAPVLLVGRSWSGWSWLWQPYWRPGLWSWLRRSWLSWPWCCWRWLR